MIAIIDYGMGNQGSILNMLRKIGYEAVVVSSCEEVSSAAKLILPGVGSFDNGINHLKKRNLIGALEKKVIVDKTPILGICLGMHLMVKGSEEGELSGLGWFDAFVKRFHFGENQRNLKIPHMGWNYAKFKVGNSLKVSENEEHKFYFVHSYHVCCNEQTDVLAETFYGYSFPSVIQKGNILGVQFHPEKSHKYGMSLLAKFIESY